VIADGGTFEAKQCLVNQLNFLNNINYLPSNYDVNAQAFINASGVTDITTIYAVNDLVISMKADGTWDKMKAIYPFVGGTATTHKFNLKDPRDLDAAFRLSFFGGVTHSSNGVLGNGTNGYANTFLTPSTSLSLNSTHVSIYSRTDATSNNGDFGCKMSTPTTSSLIGYLKFTDSKQYYIMNSTTPFGITSTTNTSLGLFTYNRNSSTTQNLYKNGIQINSTTKTSVALPNNDFYLLGINNGEVSNKQFAFASIGDGLTDTEASNLYLAVQAFQTTLNRQV